MFSFYDTSIVPWYTKHENFSFLYRLESEISMMPHTPVFKSNCSRGKRQKLLEKLSPKRKERVSITSNTCKAFENTTQETDANLLNKSNHFDDRKTDVWNKKQKRK